MKYLFRKIAITLTLVMTFVLCVPFVGCGEKPCENHSWEFISNTATCTENGIEYYKCTNCKEIKTETITAYGHSYDKNKCTRCNNIITDISEFSQSQRSEIGKKLELAAPWITDSDTVKAVQKLTLMQKEEIEDCKTKVAQAQTYYENTCQTAVVRRYIEGQGWVWVTDEKAVANAQEKLTQAKNNLAQAQADWATYKLSYEVNCEGYAWNITIIAVTSENTSNYNINYRLAVLIGLQRSVLGEENYTPEWYSEIIRTVKDICGIDILNTAE